MIIIKRTDTNNDVYKDLEKLEPSYTANGNVKWCSHSGKQYGHQYPTTGYRVTYDPGVPLQSINPREKKNICPHKNLNTNVHSTIIHNS